MPFAHRFNQGPVSVSPNITLSWQIQKLTGENDGAGAALSTTQNEESQFRWVLHTYWTRTAHHGAEEWRVYGAKIRHIACGLESAEEDRFGEVGA